MQRFVVWMLSGWGEFWFLFVFVAFVAVFGYATATMEELRAMTYEDVAQAARLFLR